MDIVLGVSGSVAAYRSADLARELMRAGHSVRVCLTDAAQRFVTPALFEALTGNPCLLDTFEEPDRGRMAHIDWARRAAVLLVAPATANTLNRLASGIGDDMLTTIALATSAPLVVAPAMNPHMYSSEATRTALQTLAARGAIVVEPTEGDVACGEYGQGKLASIATIVSSVEAVLRRSNALKGKKVLVTSGPTQEPVDSVRFLSNRSSGKMGIAIARAALLMGAEVTLVTGPTSVPVPIDATSVRVRTAQEMLEAALEHSEGADLIIGAAAVADYRPAHPVEGKLRRSDAAMNLELVPNPDIIAKLAAHRPAARVVGFAAEPGTELEEAIQKLSRKGLFAIAVNDVSDASIGFDSDENELTLVLSDGSTQNSDRQSKLACALWLLERVTS
jgi:phosphopantothenoylcysteine decarboxylase/phosphopantothenate--cysteine ligase